MCVLSVLSILLVQSLSTHGPDAQVEEKELDANKVSTAMAGLIASQKADREAQRLR